MHGLEDLWAFEDFLEIDTALHALPFIGAVETMNWYGIDSKEVLFPAYKKSKL